MLPSFLRQVVQGPPLILTDRGSTPACTRIRGVEGEEFVERRRAQDSRAQGREHRQENQFVQESSHRLAGFAAGETFCGHLS